MFNINSESLKDARVADITISDLLSHRAGFDRNTAPDTMVSLWPWCPYHVKNLQRITLNFDSNSKNIYSNVGYCLLSKIIENVYSKSYVEMSRGYFNFDSSDIRFIQSHIADRPNIPDVSNDDDFINLDFYALASVEGLTGNSNEIVRCIYKMDKVNYPNITNRPNDINL